MRTKSTPIKTSGLAKTLAILAEFLKFVLARIDCQETNLVVTIIEQDAVEFRCLCDRAELAIRTDFGTPGNDGVVHDDLTIRQMV